MQTPLQRPLQRERVQALVALAQLPPLATVQHPCVHQPLIGGARRFVALLPRALFPPLLLQLQAGQEEVHQRAPHVAVESAHRLHQLLPFQPPVAQQLTRPHPVLLLDVGVVVAVIRARAGEGHGLLALVQVAQQVVVEELAAVVAVEAQQREGQPGLHRARGRQHARRALVPHGPALGPLGRDVGVGQAPEEVPGQAGPAVGHAVGFQIAGPRHIPGAGADRDLRLEQAAGFGAAAAPQRMGGAGRRQQPVEGGRADRAQQLALLGAERAVEPLVVGQPQRQGRGLALAARLLGRQPDGPHHRLDALVARLRAGMRPPAGRRDRVAQEFDGILAFVAVVLAQLVQHPALARTAAPRIPLPQLGQQAFLDRFAHVHPHRFSGVFFP